jgi:hypothetical protein
MIDVIIPQEVYLEYREALHSAFMIVEGVVRTHGVTVSVVARRILALG